MLPSFFPRFFLVLLSSPPLLLPLLVIPVTFGGKRLDVDPPAKEMRVTLFPAIERRRGKLPPETRQQRQVGAAQRMSADVAPMLQQLVHRLGIVQIVEIVGRLGVRHDDVGDETWRRGLVVVVVAVVVAIFSYIRGWQ